MTDSKTNPATSTPFDCNADCHLRATFTFETGVDVYGFVRFVNTSNSLRIRARGSNGALYLQMLHATGDEVLAQLDAIFADGVSYQIDLVLYGDTAKLFINNVEKYDGDAGGLLLTTTGGRFDHTLVSNDLVITTHPYPALGIATDRVIAPQAADTATHTADCLMVARNVNLPTGGSLQYELRKVGADEITLDIDSNGKPILKENATAKITGANGNVSEDDDVVVILDGANASLFSDGTQIGSTVTDLSLTAGTTFNMASIGTAGSTNSVELWPRDVTSILPVELV